ncbi:trypsin-like serine protease [Pendulispora brunnea]|uniref:Trypsin-like serine protease n=1 Tax=Pendulispora brunnea TaxID=2905690 RepID=A0ABZ2K9R3_9BACT
MRNRHSIVFAGIILAIGYAGCSSNDTGTPPPARSSSPIIGGTADEGDPAVVMLVSYPADESTYYTCTAEVISPTVLLTAAHCVDTPNHTGHTFGVFLEPDATPYKSSVKTLKPHLKAVREVHAHPQYDPNGAGYPADVGVAILSEPVSITPLPINRTALDSSIVGKSSRIIGYGQTVSGTFNVKKYQATTSVNKLENDGHTVVVGDSTRRTCLGDSGGPALVTLNGVETIIGTNSYTNTSGCTEPSHFQRVDVYKSFIDSYLNSGDAGAPTDAGTDSGTDAGTDSGTPPDAGGGEPCPTPEREPNNRSTQANPIGQCLRGSLSPAGDVDLESFSLSGSLEYDVNLEASGDAQLSLFKYWNGGWYYVENTTPTRVHHVSDGGGRYLVRVTSPSYTTQSYTSTLTVGSP